MPNKNIMPSFDFVITSPIGPLGLKLSSRGLTQLVYCDSQQVLHMPTQGLALELAQQIDAYFNLELKQFDIPLDVQGTDYQNKVWREVSSIPYAQALTYGAIAKTLGTGARAVGNACRRNPVPLMIPCHRVVRLDQIGGYCGQTSGQSMQQKDWLLRHERSVLI